MESIWKYDSPVGGITLAGEGSALTGLWLPGQRASAGAGHSSGLFPSVPVTTFDSGVSITVSDGGTAERWLPVFGDACRWLDVYFSGKVPDFIPRLDLRGTPFRKDVWDILLGIPYGQTMSYGEVAALVARKRGVPRMSAQAVGGAVGHNPVSIIVPCHRVIGADGSLTGYGGGLDLKLRLLRLEGSA